jgi:hypothetical protein
VLIRIQNGGLIIGEFGYWIYLLGSVGFGFSMTLGDLMTGGSHAQ